MRMTGVVRDGAATRPRHASDAKTMRKNVNRKRRGIIDEYMWAGLSARQDGLKPVPRFNKRPAGAMPQRVEKRTACFLEVEASTKPQNARRLNLGDVVSRREFGARVVRVQTAHIALQNR